MKDTNTKHTKHDTFTCWSARFRCPCSTPQKWQNNLRAHFGMVNWLVMFQFFFAGQQRLFSCVACFAQMISNDLTTMVSRYCQKSFHFYKRVWAKYQPFVWDCNSLTILNNKQRENCIMQQHYLVFSTLRLPAWCSWRFRTAGHCSQQPSESWNGKIRQHLVTGSSQGLSPVLQPHTSKLETTHNVLLGLLNLTILRFLHNQKMSLFLFFWTLWVVHNIEHKVIYINPFYRAQVTCWPARAADKQQWKFISAIPFEWRINNDDNATITIIGSLKWARGGRSAKKMSWVARKFQKNIYIFFIKMQVTFLADQQGLLISSKARQVFTMFSSVL